MKRLMIWLAQWMNQPDKALHAGVGFAAFLLLMVGWAFFGPTWLSELLCMAVAIELVAWLAWAKERYDKAHPTVHTWDGWDAYATLRGATVGAVFWALGSLIWQWIPAFAGMTG